MVCPPYRWWETIFSPSLVYSRLCGADCSELLALSSLWQNTMSWPFPVTCLAALLVVKTCLAKEGEEWVLPMKKDVMLVGKGRSLVTDHIQQKNDPTAFLFHFFILSSSLRKNPAERMNYLELMVSAKPFLLVFITTPFKSEMNGLAGPRKMGQQDVWVIGLLFFLGHGAGWV